MHSEYTFDWAFIAFAFILAFSVRFGWGLGVITFEFIMKKLKLYAET